MVFGILVAGASSVFIAAPILLFLGDWRRRHRTHATSANDAKVEILPPEQSQPRKSAS
jgi:SecD/SecF fusion protein